MKTIESATATYVTISSTKTVVGDNLATFSWSLPVPVYSSASSVSGPPKVFISNAKFVKWSHSQTVKLSLVLFMLHPESDQPASSKFQKTQIGSVKLGLKCFSVKDTF